MSGISLVIETENVKDAGRERALEMLRVLRQELESHRDVQVVLVFDEEAASRTDVEQLLQEGGLTDLGIEIEFVATRDTAYYDSKNLGSLSATKEILVLLDSDVIPEPGWLDAMLAGIDNPDIDVIGGAVYMGPIRTLVDKAFAAFWFFPLRREAVGMRAVEHLFANNMAMRRQFFLDNPFPDDPEMTRGHCTIWASELKSNGRSLWQDTSARVAHPSPQGFVFKRGLMRGHDRYLRGKRAGTLRGGALLTSIRMLVFEIGRSSRRIFRRRKQAQLSWFEVPGAFGIAIYYWTAEWLGFVLEWLRPGWVTRRFSA